MKKKIGLVLILLLAGFFFIDSTFAESHRIKIIKKASLDGVQLKPGVYRLRVNGTNEAEIYKGGKLLVAAKIEVAPLATATPNSIAQTRTGELKEIRLKTERIVLIDFPQSVQARR